MDGAVVSAEANHIACRVRRSHARGPPPPWATHDTSCPRRDLDGERWWPAGQMILVWVGAATHVFFRTLTCCCCTVTALPLGAELLVSASSCWSSTQIMPCTW